MVAVRSGTRSPSGLWSDLSCLLLAAIFLMAGLIGSLQATLAASASRGPPQHSSSNNTGSASDCSSSSSQVSPCCAAAAAAAAAALRGSSGPPDLVEGGPLGAHAAALSGSTCFHVRNCGCRGQQAGEGADASEGTLEGGPPSEGEGALREVCVEGGESDEAPAVAAAVSSAAGRDDPSSASESEALSALEAAAPVSATRQQFYLSSLSGTDWQAKLKETQDYKRRKLLRKPHVLKALAIAALRGWDSFPEEAVSLSVISGGLSNRLYLIELDNQNYAPRPAPSGSPDPTRAGRKVSLAAGKPAVTKALIRVYGHQEGTALFNSQTERTLFKALGSLDIAPKCLADFEGGRIEAFWEAHPLLTEDLNDRTILEKAVRLITSFHEVKTADLSCLGETHLSPEKQPCGASSSSTGEETAAADSWCCCCICRLELWGRLALEALDVVHQRARAAASNSSSSSGEELLQQMESRVDALRLEEYVKETAWLSSQLRALAASDAAYFRAFTEALRRERREETIPGADDPLGDLSWLSGTFPVLSHNDFQENNILQARTAEGELKLIDFEYSGMNARAYDLGNLFCEATLDYADNPKWPFYSHRPEKMPGRELRRHLVEVYLQETLKKKGLSQWSERLLTEETISRFARSVEYMILVSHLTWGFWSVVRLEAYRQKKREIEADPSLKASL
ncbi:hypothetical protein Efla_005882 [Eimeria flavescens]